MEVRGSKLKIGYESRIVVPELDICINKKHITTIIGPNGSGKSTVLKALTRLLKYSGGAVHINGKDLQTLPASILAQYVGVLPQRHSTPPDFTVRDLVGYGRTPYQKWYQQNSPEDEAVVEWALRMTGAWELRDKSVMACSGGESQRVWIAVVLAQKPEILFLDEPTTYLDISYQLELMRLVKKLNRESSIGVVMVLHDLSQAMEVSDRIIVIKDGVKYAEGTPEEVITAKMLEEVYQVRGRLVHLAGRKKPVLVFDEI